MWTNSMLYFLHTLISLFVVVGIIPYEYLPWEVFLFQYNWTVIAQNNGDIKCSNMAYYSQRPHHRSSITNHQIPITNYQSPFCMIHNNPFSDYKRTTVQINYEIQTKVRVIVFILLEKINWNVLLIKTCRRLELGNGWQAR